MFTVPSGGGKGAISNEIMVMLGVLSMVELAMLMRFFVGDEWLEYAIVETLLKHAEGWVEGMW